jgi:hypothetical protein
MWVLKEHKVFKVLKDSREHKVLKVLKDSREFKVLKDSREHKEFKVLKELDILMLLLQHQQLQHLQVLLLLQRTNREHLLLEIA